MRSFIFIVAVLVVTITSFEVYSQSVFPIAGITLSRTTVASQAPPAFHMSTKIKAGFAAGGGIEYPIGKRLYMQSGLIFIQKGQRGSVHVKEDGYEYLASDAFQLNYLELPLQARMVLDNKGSSRFFVKIGVNTSCFVGGKTDYSYTNVTPFAGQGSSLKPVRYKSGREGPATEAFYLENRFDIGVYTGFGINLNRRLRIDLGFSQGVIRSALSENFKGANQVFQLLVSAPIEIGSRVADSAHRATKAK